MAGRHAQHLIHGQFVVAQALPGHGLADQGLGRLVVQERHVLVEGDVKENGPVIAAERFQAVGAHKDEAQTVEVLHQVPEEGEDGGLQLA